MCNYFSCAIDRTGKVYWLKNSMSYRDIITEYREYNKLVDQDSIITEIFRNIENFEDRNYFMVYIVPKDAKKVTRNREDWKFDLWEMMITPIWYRENIEQYEENCWKCWEDSVKINLAIDNETITTRDIFLLATGNSIVEAYGSAKVVAWNNVTVKAHDNVTVIACGNTKVNAYDNAIIEAHGRVRVGAYGNTTVESFSHDIVMANDNSMVKAYLHAVVNAEGNTVAKVYGSTTVKAKDNAIIDAYNHATVEAWGKSTVEAYDNVTVYKHSSDAKITIKSNTAVAMDDDTNKIIVSKYAIVDRD
jgi:hypothetical protein